jgi:hypothetical protein
MNLTTTGSSMPVMDHGSRLNYGSFANFQSVQSPEIKRKTSFIISTVFLAVVAVALVACMHYGFRTALFEDPEDASLDPTSWAISGLLNDGIDGSSDENPFHLPPDGDVGERNGPFLRDLSRNVAGGGSSGGDEFATNARRQMLLQGAQEKEISLLGGDDWLGAPFAVPDDVREHGEQKIGDEVNYWNTHSGDIGTKRGQYSS